MKELKSKKTFIKYRTKLLFKDNIYDSFADLGEELFKENLLSYKNNTREDLSKLLSTMIGFAKKKHCPFIMLKDKYIFFSEYEVLCKDSRGAFKLSEKPVSKSVEDTYDYYINLLDNIIGDISVSELLQSTKDTFYKLDNMYFKNECNIKPYAYDKTIDKQTVLSLINNTNYKFLFDKDNFNLDNTTKNKFYIKNNYIFLNKNDYINRFIRILVKEEVLEDLNLIV